MTNYSATPSKVKCLPNATGHTNGSREAVWALLESCRPDFGLGGLEGSKLADGGGMSLHLSTL